jgi:hypothetical protein
MQTDSSLTQHTRQPCPQGVDFSFQRVDTIQQRHHQGQAMGF